MSFGSEVLICDFRMHHLERWLHRTEQKCYLSVSTVGSAQLTCSFHILQEFCAFYSGFQIEIITKLSGDISHILNNYLEHSKSIKLGDFVKASVVPDDYYVESLAITEISVILLEHHSP